MLLHKVPGRFALASSGLVAMLSAVPAQAAYQLNMTESVTPIGRELYGLHMLVFWICVGIGILVFGAMAWSIIHHRKSKGAKPADFSHSTVAEVI